MFYSFSRNQSVLNYLVGTTGGVVFGPPLLTIEISAQPMNVSFSTPIPKPDWPVMGSVPQLFPVVYFHWNTQCWQIIVDGNWTRMTTGLGPEPYLSTSRNFVEPVPTIVKRPASRQAWVAIYIIRSIMKLTLFNINCCTYNDWDINLLSSGIRFDNTTCIHGSTFLELFCWCIVCFTTDTTFTSCESRDEF
jgi:hypothetical protein